MQTKTIDNRPYYFLPQVPVVKSMVLNGGLLPLEEIDKTLQAWNMKPIVFGHPKTPKGELMSAADDSQLDSHFGFVNNATIDKDRMKADLYLLKSKIDSSPQGQRLLADVAAGKRVNVSTAYFDKSHNIRGEEGGKSYDRVQTYIAPDHLAILLDEPGACATHDGCGINVNNLGDNMSDSANDQVSDEIADSVATFLTELEAGVMEKLTANAAAPAGTAQSFDACMKEINELKSKVSKLEAKKKVNANAGKKPNNEENDEDEDDEDEEDDEVNDNSDESDNDDEPVKGKKKSPKKPSANSQQTVVNADYSGLNANSQQEDSSLNYGGFNPFLKPSLTDYLANQNKGAR